MPAFSTPPHRPARTHWRQSFYYQDVSGLPALANSGDLITALESIHGEDWLHWSPFGNDNWDASYIGTNGSADYFSDAWPETRPISRATWFADQPQKSGNNPHLFWPDLRQQGATKRSPIESLFNIGTEYRVALGSGPTASDRHAICWSEETDELLEAIGYNGGLSYLGYPTACESIVTWNLTSYALPLSANNQPVGVCAARIPIAPFFFTYEDLLDCGNSGDLGHMLGVSLENYGTTYTWPARAGDGTASGSPIQAGMVLRLKSTFDLSTLPNNPLKALARTLQKYGMMVYDRNFKKANLLSPCDPAWPQKSNDLGALLANKMPFSEFEVVNMSSVAGTTNSIQVTTPVPTPPFPVVTDVDKWSTPVNGGTKIVMYGIHLQNTSSVRFDNDTIPSPSWSVSKDGKRIIAFTPDLSALTLGPGGTTITDVTVTTPGGSITLSQFDLFVYTVSPATKIAGLRA
jgi:hypothetical protein